MIPSFPNKIWTGVSRTRPDGLQADRAPDLDDWKAIVTLTVQLQQYVLDLENRFQVLINLLSGQPHSYLDLSQSVTCCVCRSHTASNSIQFIQQLVHTSLRNRSQLQLLQFNQAAIAVSIRNRFGNHSLSLAQKVSVHHISVTSVNQRLAFSQSAQVQRVHMPVVTQSLKLSHLNTMKKKGS